MDTEESAKERKRADCMTQTEMTDNHITGRPDGSSLFFVTAELLLFFVYPLASEIVMVYDR